MTWESWQRAWLEWSNTQVYHRRVKRAVEVVQDVAASGRPLYAGISGGKDSVAMAWIINIAGAKDIVWAHAYTPLETPGMLDAANATASLFDRELDIIEPDVGAPFWEWFRDLRPVGCNPFREPFRQKIRDTISSGALLNWYCVERRFAGYLTGMRSEESRGRRMNRKIRGLSYELKSGVTVTNPLGDWSARDVWAAIAANRLPTCPHYQLALERFGISPESPTSRVDMVVAPETATALPVMYTTRTLYPELYRRICEARPECRKET